MKMQEALFNMIRDTVSNPKSVAKTVQEVLEISSDAAYRRLRGETALGIDEAFKLANHYEISLTELENFRSNHVTFIKRPFIDTIDRFEFFLSQSLEHLNALQTDPDHLMLYMAKDIPIFYQYKYPTINAFRIWVWMRNIFSIEKIENEYYNLDTIPQILTDLCHKQWEAYSKLNTIEIWNETTPLSLLNQIQYFFEAGMLRDKEQALDLCNEAEELLKFVYQQALHGLRLDDYLQPAQASYQLFYNEIIAADNGILSRINGRFLFNVPYAAVNFLSTQNQTLGTDMYKYFLRQADKSILISKTSEKERNRFFKRQEQRINDLKMRIEQYTPFTV